MVKTAFAEAMAVKKAAKILSSGIIWASNSSAF